MAKDAVPGGDADGSTGRGPVTGTAAITDGEWHAARELLERAATVVLLAHVQPDADALGSSLALGLALRRRGADVRVSFAEPAFVPQSLRGLPGQELIAPPAALPPRPDLVVTLDVGAPQRLGSLQSLLPAAASVLVIDHHRTNTRFGTHHLLDPRAEATGVLVARLLDVMGLPIDTDMASGLYAAIATDTVAFRFATADTHRLAARLVDAGVRPAELLAPITDEHPLGWLPMLSAVLGRTAAAPGGTGPDLVHTCVTLDDAAGLRPEEVDSVIDIVRTTAGSGVTAVAKQTGADHWQVSLRSAGETDVAAVATALGGGGHRWAAGFTHRGDYASAVDRLLGVLSPDAEEAAPGITPQPSGPGADPRHAPDSG